MAGLLLCRVASDAAQNGEATGPTTDGFRMCCSLPCDTAVEVTETASGPVSGSLA